MNPTTSFRIVAIAAALCALTACAETGGAGASGGGGARRDENAAPPAVQQFSPETQAFMKAGLHQFGQGDPRWETTRAEWLAMGPDEADFLVTNMWAALLRCQAVNDPEKVEKLRHELAMIGEPAIPMMAAFVAGGTAYSSTDPDTGERHDFVIDDMARSEASQVLSLIGAPAVPAVRDALTNAASKAGKRCALQTLGYLGDRGGPSAVEPLLEYARGDDDVLRTEAVTAMKYCHDDATREALLTALGDADVLVRKRAAESLMNRRDASAVGAIRAAAERARGEAKLAEAAEMNRAATWIEQHPK